MTNWFQDSLADMEAGLVGSVSNPVVYKHGTTEISCNAVLAQTEYEANGYNGFVVETKQYDFLILASDLSITPEAGDFIVYDGIEYEVMPIGDLPCYGYTTPYKNMYRIHTKVYK